MKTIKGIWETRQVFIDGKELLPLKPQDIDYPSSGGYMWGYNGSAPARLALAILSEFIADYSVALDLHQTFKVDIISQLKQKEDFEISFNKIQRWIDKQ